LRNVSVDFLVWDGDFHQSGSFTNIILNIYIWSLKTKLDKFINSMILFAFIFDIDEDKFVNNWNNAIYYDHNNNNNEHKERDNDLEFQNNTNEMLIKQEVIDINYIVIPYHDNISSVYSKYTSLGLIALNITQSRTIIALGGGSVVEEEFMETYSFKDDDNDMYKYEWYIIPFSRNIIRTNNNITDISSYNVSSVDSHIASSYETVIDECFWCKFSNEFRQQLLTSRKYQTNRNPYK
jgi:hypothetical protein